jgi:hypothetical protein
MRCGICKQECGRTICSEKCRAILADRVSDELAKRNGFKRKVHRGKGGNRWKTREDRDRYLGAPLIDM